MVSLFYELITALRLKLIIMLPQKVYICMVSGDIVVLTTTYYKVFVYSLVHWHWHWTKNNRPCSDVNILTLNLDFPTLGLGPETKIAVFN